MSSFSGTNNLDDPFVVDDDEDDDGGRRGVQVVLIPDDPSKPLQLHRLRTKKDPHEETSSLSSTSSSSIVVRRSIESLLMDSSLPFPSPTNDEQHHSQLQQIDKDQDQQEGQDHTQQGHDDNPTIHVETPLIRPNIDKQSPGLYAYFLPQIQNTMKTRKNINEDSTTTLLSSSSSSSSLSSLSSKLSPNVRATRLAMSCGLFSIRFVGPVVVMRCQYIPSLKFDNLTLDDLYFACEVSPDLRRLSQQLLHHGVDHSDNHNVGDGNCDEDNDNHCHLRLRNSVRIPDWLTSAAYENYHDASAVSRMAKIFTTNNYSTSSSAGTKHDDDDDDGDEHDSESKNDCDDDDNHDDRNKDINNRNDEKSSSQKMKEAVTKTPICLHCRRPTNNLCPGCKGAYFCPPSDVVESTSSSTTATTRRDCRKDGWSHDCLCSTWKQYTNRRIKLSTFEFFGLRNDDDVDDNGGDDDWPSTLTGREFQISEQPYEDWLRNRGLMGVVNNVDDRNHSKEDLENSKCGQPSSFSSATSWWMTEIHGWAGGQSNSARQVDARVRKSYACGFAPLPLTEIPPQRRVTQEDWDRAECSSSPIPTNSVGLRTLSSWKQYYLVRNIPARSPIALLCTFPLTVYYAIVQYGEVPVTVAKIMNRPLKIHLVGAEKELHLLDLFQEIAFLLPEEIKVEIIMIVRKDMLPPSHRQQQEHKRKNLEGSLLLRVGLASNLTVGIAAGSYGDPSSLDPTFDLGGPPDMVIALNAGLFAYESWRSVVEYLDHNRGVVGVFTDYNEHSGVNCAGLGGTQSRNSLALNPFRQPRAMPVYSMNLPQFSNGFFYVFHEQALE